MIFDYLIFESYLHISHLIFDIIHPSHHTETGGEGPCMVRIDLIIVF